MRNMQKTEKQINVVVAQHAMVNLWLKNRNRTTFASQNQIFITVNAILSKIE